MVADGSIDRRADEGYTSNYQCHTGPITERCDRSCGGERPVNDGPIVLAESEQGILSPIVDRLNHAVSATQADGPTGQPALIQAINAMTACFKGLSPSDDDIFDLSDEQDDGTDKQDAVEAIRRSDRMVALRARIQSAIAGLVQVWHGDGGAADVREIYFSLKDAADDFKAISSLVKHATLSSSETLVSLSPLPLLALVCSAAERIPSALWMSLASTLTLRINAPPSFLTQKRQKTPLEEELYKAEEEERWTAIANAAERLVPIAVAGLSGEGVREVSPSHRSSTEAHASSILISLKHGSSFPQPWVYKSQRLGDVADA